MNRKKSNSLQLSGSFLFSNCQPQNPYRATRMWHKSVQLFLEGVPLTQHRHRSKFWRTHESTFTGSEAITWFHEKLCFEFDPAISREQTKLLLQKFYRTGVFANVEGGADNEDEGKEFRDSQMQIYRLSMERRTESPPKKSPKKTNYAVEIKPLSSVEIEQIHFDLLLERLADHQLQLTNCPIQQDNISKNLQSPKQPLPSWLLSAMKCLAQWPEKTEYHVDYVNFECDVFKLIVDYFASNLERIGPLLENGSLFAEFHSSAIRSPKNKFEDKFPFPRSEFEEIDRIFTPSKRQYSRFVMGRNRRRIFDSTDANSSMDSLAVPSPMEVYDSGRYKTRVWFETAFVTEQSPVTRVLSQNRLHAYENPSLSLSPADLINHPKYNRLKWINRSMSTSDLVDGVNRDLIDELDDPVADRNCVEVLSLLLLTLPPLKRKHLEVLLRFMGKINKNQSLSLDVSMSNRDIMLNSFGTAIGSVPHRLISFMTENVDQLFRGETLDNFKRSVDERLKAKQIRRVPLVDSKENSYCSKISMVEYENQRLLGETAKSLRSLLDAIVAGKDEKVKRKQLKNREYPHIYNEKFAITPKKKNRTPFGVLI